MSSINNSLKNIFLNAYKVFDTAIIRSDADGIINSQPLSWGNAVNNKISSNSIIFNVAKNKAPEEILIAPFTDVNWFSLGLATKDANTKYFDNFSDLFSTKAERGNQTAKVGKKFTNGTYDFIITYLGANPNIDNLFTFEALIEEATNIVDSNLYAYFQFAFSQALDGENDIPFIAKIDSGFSNLYYLVQPFIEVFETGAFYQVAYAISDYYETEMTFPEESKVKIGKIQVEIQEN